MTRPTPHYIIAATIDDDAQEVLYRADCPRCPTPIATSSNLEQLDQLAFSHAMHHLAAPPDDSDFEPLPLLMIHSADDLPLRTSFYFNPASDQA